jgi:hypothetical protein
VRSPRPRSPKSVREFINERIGVQTRDEILKKEVSRLEDEKVKEKNEAVEETVVYISYSLTNFRRN